MLRKRRMTIGHATPALAAFLAPATTGHHGLALHPEVRVRIFKKGLTESLALLGDPCCVRH